MTATDISIDRAMTEMVQQWQQKGFNGIRFCDLRMSTPGTLQDWLADGKTAEEWREWLRNYSNFIAQPDPDEMDHIPESKYHKAEIDWFQIYDDMKAEIRKRVGDGVEIIHYEACNEFEVIRHVS